MRNIGTTTFVLLMLDTAIIGSGHLVLARIDNTRDITNSGNYLVNDQNCTASNTVTSWSSGLTSPPPSTSPTPTTLTLQIGGAEGLISLRGSLKTETGPIVGATITFITTEGHHNPPTVVFVGTRPPTVVTGNDGSYFAIAGNHNTGGTIITAHYVGAPPPNALAASNSAPVTVPGCTDPVHNCP